MPFFINGSARRKEARGGPQPHWPAPQVSKLAGRGCLSQPKECGPRYCFTTERPHAGKTPARAAESRGYSQSLHPPNPAMIVTLASQNVQGLNEQNKHDVVRGYYRSLFKELDFLCIQEHHLRGTKLSSLSRSFWPQATFFGQEAAVGFGHAEGEPGAGTGGVCMWAAPRIAQFVTSSRNSQCRRAQWVCLSGIPGGNLAVLNVSHPTALGEG